jgi:hypothetical protein
MTTSDSIEFPSPPSVEDLRDRILTSALPPADDVADFMMVMGEARQTIEQDRIVPRGTEVRVRLAGDGVPGHDVPVHLAAQLLDALQGAITAVGSSLHKSEHIKAPKHADTGKRIGVRAATELRLSPTIGAGSVVFFLEGPAEKLRDDELIPVRADSLVDTAVVELFAVLKKADADSPDHIGQLTDELNRLGAMVGSKLNTLASFAVASDIELDLGHRSPSGDRHAVFLGRRGAEAINEAVERNRERVKPETFTGVLNTVSDGADKLRMTLDDEKTQLRMDVEPAVGLHLGAMLGQRVVAETETTIKWKLASGKERRSYELLSARLADAEDA